MDWNNWKWSHQMVYCSFFSFLEALLASVIKILIAFASEISCWLIFIKRVCSNSSRGAEQKVSFSTRAATPKAYEAYLDTSALPKLDILTLFLIGQNKHTDKYFLLRPWIWRNQDIFESWLIDFLQFCCIAWLHETFLDPPPTQAYLPPTTGTNNMSAHYPLVPAVP